jgi:hypothetical protein
MEVAMQFRITSWLVDRGYGVNIHGERVLIHRSQLPRWGELKKKNIEVGDVFECEVEQTMRIVRAHEVEGYRSREGS